MDETAKEIRMNGDDPNDGFRAQMLHLTRENTEVARKVAAELGDMRKEIKNIYLIAASIVVIALMSSLLWFDKMDSKMFACFTTACLFPWYGTGFEKMLRVWRGERDGQNKRDGRALGLLFLAVVITIIHK